MNAKSSFKLDIGDDPFMRQWLMDAIIECVRDLSNLERMAICEILDGMSVQQRARKYNVTSGTINDRDQRALAKIGFTFVDWALNPKSLIYRHRPRQ